MTIKQFAGCGSGHVSAPERLDRGFRFDCLIRCAETNES